MDSTAPEGRENVDINDSNSDGKFYKALPSNNLNSKETKVVSHTNDLSFSSSASSASSEVVEGSSLPIPPDGGWGWVVVFASFMINFIADGVSLSFGILFVDLVKYFGESKAKTSWVGSIFLSMPLLAGPIASYLSDRYGCQRVCIFGALLATAAFIVSIFADSLELLFLTFSIAGLGLALCYVTSIVVVAYYFEKRRSLATGLAACGTGIGTFVFPPITIYLLEEYDWQGTLLILSGFFLNMVVFGALMRDLESNSKTNDDEKRSYNGNLDHETSALEDSERLCSSLVQLPTYLCDNLPMDVITELSSKEGGYLNSLLEQHPYLLNTIIANNEKDSVKEHSLNVLVDSQPDPKKKSKEKYHLQMSKNIVKCNSGQMSKEPSFPSKLDAAYLRNMRLQRGSITYRGAMLNIHRYRLRASSCPDIYRNSMVTISEEKSCLFLDDLKELMLDMFDFSIFKNIQYTLFCISNFLLYACVDVPYVYIPDHAYTRGTDMESASFLISVLGVLNTLGVVIVGFIGDKPWIDPSLLYSGFILLSGLALVLLPVVANYYMTASLVGIYGFTISANYTLVPIIIVNLISLDSFTGAYGLLLLVQGIASLVGPPIAGALFDMTGNYDITFYCTGLCILVSGLMVIPVAKSFLCGRSPSTRTSSKELVHLDSRVSKVRFHESTAEEQELRNSSTFNAVPAESVDARGLYDQEENIENHTSVPLLSGKKKSNSVVANSSPSTIENPQITTIYENPFSFP